MTDHPVTFRLVSGSGPVYICGTHAIEHAVHEDEDEDGLMGLDEEIEEEEEPLPEPVGLDLGIPSVCTNRFRLSVPRSSNELLAFVISLNLWSYVSMDSSRQALQTYGNLYLIYFRMNGWKPEKY